MKSLTALTFASLLLFVLLPHAVVGAEDAGAVPAPLALGVEHSIAGYANPFESTSCLGSDASSVSSQPDFLRSGGTRWGGWFLPSCFAIEGTYCPTQGGPLVRCMWQAGEPGVCACGADNTYFCG